MHRHHVPEQPVRRHAELVTLPGVAFVITLAILGLIALIFWLWITPLRANL